MPGHEKKSIKSFFFKKKKRYLTYTKIKTMKKKRTSVNVDQTTVMRYLNAYESER